MSRASDARRVSSFFMLIAVGVTLSACRLGTIDEEELEATYEIQWAHTPADTLADLQERLERRLDGEEYGLKSLSLGERITSVELREMASGRVYTYYYDARTPFGASLGRGTLDAANDDDPESTLFGFDDIPLDALESMIDDTRASSTFEPASLRTIRFEGSASGVEIWIHLYTVGDSHHETFDALNYQAAENTAIAPETTGPTPSTGVSQPETPPIPGEMTVQGDIEVEDVRSDLRRSTRGLVRCFEAGETASFEFELVVGPTGRILTARVVTDDVLSSEAQDCVEEAATRWRVSNPSGGAAIIRFPVNYR